MEHCSQLTLPLTTSNLEEISSLKADRLCLTLVAKKISPAEVYERVRLDFPSDQARSGFMDELRSHAHQNIPYLRPTKGETASWVAFPRGKTKTGYCYIWDLYVRSADIVAA